MNIENGTFQMIPVIMTFNNTIYSTPYLIVSPIGPPIKMKLIRIFIVSVTNKSMTFQLFFKINIINIINKRHDGITSKTKM